MCLILGFGLIRCVGSAFTGAKNTVTGANSAVTGAKSAFTGAKERILGVPFHLLALHVLAHLGPLFLPSATIFFGFRI